MKWPAEFDETQDSPALGAMLIIGQLHMVKSMPLGVLAATFRCPRCKAEPGDPCRKPDESVTWFHTPRQDKGAHAYNSVIPSAWAKDVAVYGRGRDLPARDAIREMKHSPGVKHLAKIGWLGVSDYPNLKRAFALAAAHRLAAGYVD